MLFDYSINLYDYPGMTPETRFSRNPETRYYLVALAILIICVSGTSATAHQLYYKHDHYSLLYYKNKYSTEIYTYCVKRFRPKESKLKKCMKLEQRSKRIILNVALKQLGNEGDAQRIYEQCMGYYPTLGVTRISRCVKTRLILESKLKFEVIEQEIYKRCDLKWRKHGAGAVDNCSRAGANTYLDKGVFRD